MHRITVVWVVALLGGTGALLAAVPREIALIEKSYRSAGALEAEFTQRFLPKGFRKEQIERGRVVFGAPPRMRWNYVTPEAKSFTFDGATSWLYSPFERQVTIKELSEEERRSLPFLFLSEASAVDRQYFVTEKRVRGSVVTTLKAKRADAPIAVIVVTSDGKLHRIRRLEYTDRQGNRTSVDFANYRSIPAAAGLFTFAPPAGTEIIRQ